MPKSQRMLESAFASGHSIKAHAMATNTPSVFDLSPAEKLQLVQDLWDDLAADANSVPVQEWQKAELERRKANLKKNPASASSWEDVQRRIRKGNGRKTNHRRTRLP
jgi:putative addiction module component (TIGR02574 family)